MRYFLPLALLAGFLVPVFAEQAEVRVFCPAVSFDDYDERGVNGPDGPHRVVLMVVAKVARPATKPAPPKNGLPERPFENQDGAIELLVERVLFGSPPGKRFRLPGHYGNPPDDADRVSHIYGIVVSHRNGKLSYDRDDYYFYDRTYELDQLQNAEALAQARLDLLVLSSSAIVVGRPQPAAKGAPQAKPPADPFDGPLGDAKAPPHELLIERVLHGDFQAGQRIAVSSRETEPIPLPGGGACLYFLEASKAAAGGKTVHQVKTRWSTEAVDAVTAALQRRQEYPIREKVDEYGRTERSQEIVLLGPRANAIEMFRSTERVFEILAARRLLNDGEQALPDVLAAIEKDLWTEKEENGNFRRQANLIRVLGILEDHRSDGHVARLIDEILTKAEQGATFPAPPPKGDEVDRAEPRRYSNEFGTSRNHSLGWLLLTLSEVDAARLFGQRLLKLRDLAAYGWKDDAQFVLDASHIEDHLELAKVAAASDAPKPVRWQAGFDAHGLTHYRAAFSPDGKWFAAVGDSGRVWSTADWSLAAEFKPSGSVKETAFSPDGENLFVAGGGGIAILDRWDWRAGKVTQRYPGHDSAIDAMQLSRDGQLLMTSVAYKGSTILFDAKTAEVRQRFAKDEWDEIKLRSDSQRFLARAAGNRWFVGETRGKAREQLPFSTLDVAWAGADLWSLEQAAAPAPAAKGGKVPGKTAPAAPPKLSKPAVRPPGGGQARQFEILPSPVDDPFGDEAEPFFDRDKPRRNSVLRQRRGEGKFAVLLERPLSFAANELLVSDDGKTVVALNERQVEVFRSPDWKSAAAWRFPKRAQTDRERFEGRERHYSLSADGKLLAVAEEYTFPKLFETSSGKPVVLSAGHSNQIVAIDFAENGELRTRDADGIVLRWNAASGEALAADERDASDLSAADDPWRRDRQDEFLAEDGKTWQLVGQDGGAYERYTSFRVQVIDKGATPPEDRFDKEPRKGVEVRGVIVPKWGQRVWKGLVPGGEYLHVGSQIFARRDLKPVSAANVSGEIDQIVFSPDGQRYALLTSERESRPSGLPGVRVRHEVSQRLRVHNTRTGETQLAATSPSHIRLIAFARDGSRLAAVNDRQEIEVWPLGE